jgi:hypothetical protein
MQKFKSNKKFKIMGLYNNIEFDYNVTKCVINNTLIQWINVD